MPGVSEGGADSTLTTAPAPPTPCPKSPGDSSLSPGRRRGKVGHTMREQLKHLHHSRRLRQAGPGRARHFSGLRLTPENHPGEDRQTRRVLEPQTASPGMLGTDAPEGMVGGSYKVHRSLPEKAVTILLRYFKDDPEQTARIAGVSQVQVSAGNAGPGCGSSSLKCASPGIPSWCLCRLGMGHAAAGFPLPMAMVS